MNQPTKRTYIDTCMLKSMAYMHMLWNIYVQNITKTYIYTDTYIHAQAYYTYTHTYIPYIPYKHVNMQICIHTYIHTYISSIAKRSCAVSTWCMRAYYDSTTFRFKFCFIDTCLVLASGVNILLIVENFLVAQIY